MNTTKTVLAGALAVLVVGAAVSFAAAIPAHAAEQARGNVGTQAHDSAPEQPPETADGDVSEDSPADAPENVPVDLPAVPVPEPGSEPKQSAVSDAGNSSDDAAASQGPPTDMPSVVPEHVVERHDLIRQFLGGELAGALGQHMQKLVDVGGAAE